jgi:hypothetical protein
MRDVRRVQPSVIIYLVSQYMDMEEYGACARSHRARRMHAHAQHSQEDTEERIQKQTDRQIAAR